MEHIPAVLLEMDDVTICVAVEQDGLIGFDIDGGADNRKLSRSEARQLAAALVQVAGAGA